MAETKNTQSELVQLARLAEMTERYDDMREFTKQLISDRPGPIDSLERDLLSSAYKNAVGIHRSAHRTICALATRKSIDERDKGIIEDYRKEIQKRVEIVCTELQDLLDKYLLPTASGVDSKVFYLKMKGDYMRYLAETKENDDDFGDVVEKSRSAYQEAFELATGSLSPTDPLRLGLVLNFSVFYYEIANAAPEAAQLAKKAYDDAVAKLEDLDESAYKDSTLIMELLRENLALWKLNDDSSPDAEEEKRVTPTKEEQKERSEHDDVAMQVDDQEGEIARQSEVTVQVDVQMVIDESATIYDEGGKLKSPGEGTIGGNAKVHDQSGKPKSPAEDGKILCKEEAPEETLQPDI